MLVEKIRVYGELIGIGFQLQDDYLDVYAEQAKFGKQVGGDTMENKKTFLLLTALADAKGETRTELDRLMLETDMDKKVSGVRAIYDQLEIPNKTRTLITSYFDKAEQMGQELAHFKGFEHIDAFFRALIKRDY